MMCMLCNGNHTIIYSGMCFPVDEYNYTSENGIERRAYRRQVKENNEWNQVRMFKWTFLCMEFSVELKQL